MIITQTPLRMSLLEKKRRKGDSPRYCVILQEIVETVV